MVLVKTYQKCKPFMAKKKKKKGRGEMESSHACHAINHSNNMKIHPHQITCNIQRCFKVQKRFLNKEGVLMLTNSP